MSRILMVNYEYPPLGGGAGNATANIAREMVAQGAEVLVVTSAFRDLPGLEKADGFTVRRIPTWRRHAEKCSAAEMAVFMVSACAHLPRLARTFSPTAQVAFFTIPCGPSAWLAKLACGAPYVVSLRGGDVPGFQPYDLARVHRLTGPLIRFLWARAGAVVANSQGLAELARRSAPKLDVPVIPNGVDCAYFRPRSGERAPGPVRLVFCGRVVRQKGLDILIEALSLLPLEPAWELHVLGDGPARPALAKAARDLGFGDRIFFQGWLAKTELALKLRDMDLFVFPSRDEGLPNAVLEAMASGLPVLASRISGNEELVDQGATGRLVPPEDPKALALALGELLADLPRLGAMGRCGREKAQGDYSWSRVAKAYLDLCERLT
jgi:glycosyltransferase involved in cell wall biosynthesis